MGTATPRPSRSDERGIALAMALLGIVMIGALVTGTLFAGRMEMSSGRNTVYTAQATEAAEAGLTAAFNPWNTAWNSTTNYPISTTLASGVGQGTVYPFSGGGLNNSSVRYTTTVRRLQGGIYQITSLGEKLDRSGNVLATRLLSELGKLVVPNVTIQAAVTANADVQVNGSTTKVDGHDQVPTGWGGQCPVPAAGTGVYGIRTNQQVGTSGHPDIQGVPAATLQNDGTVTAATFLTPFNALAPLANKTITGNGLQNLHPAPTISGSPSTCNRSDPDNWGEPQRSGGYVAQCVSYMPIIYYSGTGVLKLSTGRAQGIILSAGDIDIAGNFEFDGIMIALGSIDTHGTGNKVTGAVLSGNANINDDDVIAGTPTILYSSCAVQTVLQGAATGVPLTQRRWAQLNPR